MLKQKKMVEQAIHNRKVLLAKKEDETNNPKLP